MKIPFESENILAEISRRCDGSMRLHGHTAYDAPAIANRNKWLIKLGAAPEHTISAGLVHGAHVEAVSDPKQAGIRVEQTDALITDQKGTFLSITAADCFPLYLYDPIKQVVGLAHCGWKGILAGVVKATIEAMTKQYNCDPNDIEAVIGPGVGLCHFEVGADIAAKFPGFSSRVKKYIPIEGISKAAIEDKAQPTWHYVDAWYVDLPAAIIHQLGEVGVMPYGIQLMKQCTYCFKAFTELKPLQEKSVIEYQYFSFRRDRSDPLKTMMCVIGMKN